MDHIQVQDPFARKRARLEPRRAYTPEMHQVAAESRVVHGHDSRRILSFSQNLLFDVKISTNFRHKHVNNSSRVDIDYASTP